MQKNMEKPNLSIANVFSSLTSMQCLEINRSITAAVTVVIKLIPISCTLIIKLQNKSDSLYYSKLCPICSICGDQFSTYLTKHPSI